MFAESESDVVVDLKMNCNLKKTMVSTYLAWRCPYHYLSSVSIRPGSRRFLSNQLGYNIRYFTAKGWTTALQTLYLVCQCCSVLLYL